MSANDFSMRENGFGYDVFRRVKEGFEDLDLVHFKNGWKRVTPNAFDVAGFTTRTGGDYAFFRPTAALLALAEEHGALPFQEHWRSGRLPLMSKAPLIELRARKREGQRQGALMPLVPGDKLTAFYIRDLEEMNVFLGKADIKGIVFGGLKRVFNDGDVPGVHLSRGGRYYSRRGGDRYEMMDGEVRRSILNIQGERVVEVDISAAHLTILYALQGVPFDATHEDPYGDGDMRLPFKLCVASGLGRKTLDAAGWSPRSGQEYRQAYPDRNLGKDYRYGEIKRLVIGRHPVLRDLPNANLGALDFQFHESEIMRIAMANLRRSGIASLPVHDSLIVPRSKVTETIQAIERGFEVGLNGAAVKPRVKVKGL